MNIDPTARPTISPGFRLQWETAQDAFVMLYPEGMIKLNRSAGEILTRCRGELTVAQIIAELEQAFAANGLADDVTNMLAHAAEKHWVEFKA